MTKSGLVIYSEAIEMSTKCRPNPFKFGSFLIVGTTDFGTSWCVKQPNNYRKIAKLKRIWPTLDEHIPRLW